MTRFSEATVYCVILPALLLAQCCLIQGQNFTELCKSRVPLSNTGGTWNFLEDIGECIFIASASSTWENAELECLRRGAHLAVLNPSNTPALNALINSVAPGSSVPYYIGLRVSDLNLGEYTWVDFSPLTYSNWAPNQPSSISDHNTDYCVTMDSTSGKWSDRICSSNTRYFCQRKPYDDHGVPSIPTRDPLGRHGGCKEGWVSFGPQCYYISSTDQATTWAEALESCRDGATTMKNASLASVLASVENDFLITQLKGRATDPTHMNYNGVWLGLHETGRDIFEWSDHSRYVYNNWHYNYPRYNFQLECISMMTESNKVGRWTDLECTKRLPYVCKAPKDFDLPEHQTPPTICGSTYEQYDDVCFKVIALPNEAQRTWSHAQQLCSLQPGENVPAGGGGLATIADVYENAFVRILVDKAAAQAANPGLDLSFLKTKAWLGMREEYGNYRWQNNCPVRFTNMDSLVGNAQENLCVDMNLDGKWHPHNCSLSEVRFAVCERRLVPCPSIPTERPEICPENFPQACAHHCYTSRSIIQHLNQSELATFDEARSKCIALGGDLATIRTKEDQDCVHPFVQYAEMGMWMGLRNKAGGAGASGIWQWIDQYENAEPTTYVNWMTGEPNMFGASCGEMYPNGFWNDAGCYERRGYICQAARNRTAPVTQPTRPPGPPCGEQPTDGSGTWYYLESVRECIFVATRIETFENAELACRQRRSGLVVVNNEIQPLITEILKNTSGMLPGTPQFFIGLRITNVDLGEYTWLDGRPIVGGFTNWAPNQPASEQNQKNCVIMSGMDGKWASERCGTYTKYICQRPAHGDRPPPVRPTRPSDGSHAGCASGWVPFGPNCYFLSVDRQTYTWAEALSTCTFGEFGHQMRNSSLVSILSGIENDFIVTLLKNRKYNVWIGLHEVEPNVFEWSDHHTYRYNNWHYQYPRDTAGWGLECINMLVDPRTVGRWTDLSCQARGGYICKAPKDFAMKPYEPPPTNCSAGYQPYGDACFQVVHLERDGEHTWSHAEQQCRPSAMENWPGGGGLATISDVYENAFVRVLVDEAIRFGRPGQDFRSPKAWLGMREEYGHYSWYNQCPAHFTNLDSLIGDENSTLCVDMDLEGGWHAHGCSDRDVRMAVCERRFVPCPKINSTTSETVVCPKEFPLACGNHCYFVRTIQQHNNQTDQTVLVTFNEARATCLAMGGDLVSIRSEEQQKCVRPFAQYSIEGLWIGLRNLDLNSSPSDTSKWVWTDRDNNTEPALYANWYLGEPTSGGSERCAEMYPDNGYWNNLRCDADVKRGYICQADRSRVVMVTGSTIPPTTVSESVGGSSSAVTGPSTSQTTKGNSIATGTIHPSLPTAAGTGTTRDFGGVVSSTASPEETGLAGGSIAGIVIGVLLGVALLCAVAFVVLTGRTGLVIATAKSTGSRVTSRWRKGSDADRIPVVDMHHRFDASDSYT
ncbi:macrophage mannose receptor 1-like [Paramacrobiotus metropolitanus]|uniref:macrophage mannose receptor 1-like n=1 Tax=Paramacrobiotus metropolitanus TaxID=2943436 RepID=UPI00244590AA|nr:macrophage mannose receptor 1-like [Paramacrobiotus metropolitanus]